MFDFLKSPGVFQIAKKIPVRPETSAEPRQMGAYFPQTRISGSRGLFHLYLNTQDLPTKAHKLDKEFSCPNPAPTRQSVRRVIHNLSRTKNLSVLTFSNPLYQ